MKTRNRLEAEQTRRWMLDTISELLSIRELVRSRAGTYAIYLLPLNPAQRQAFLARNTSYATKANAKIEQRTYFGISTDGAEPQPFVIVRVIQQGTPKGQRKTPARGN